MQPLAALLYLNSSLFAFDLPLALKPLSVPLASSPFPLPRFQYLSYRAVSYTLSPARPQDHQTKLIHTLSIAFFAALPPSPSRYPNPIKATTGSVAYTWEDNRPFTKLRPIYEPDPSYIKIVSSPRGQGLPPLYQHRTYAGISFVPSSIP
jgi:hypothetical protein